MRSVGVGRAGTIIRGGVSCPTCGSDAEPFIVAPHECRDGVLAMPFGMQVSGLTSPEARKLFLSDEGQRALHESYTVLFERQRAAGGRVN